MGDTSTAKRLIFPQREGKELWQFCTSADKLLARHFESGDGGSTLTCNAGLGCLALSCGAVG